MRTPVMFAALAALSCAPLAAQNVYNQIDNDRVASTVFVFANQRAESALSLSYSAPMWKPIYDEKFDSEVKGKKSRLGKNWWTTLQTATDIEIGSKKIPSGNYVLGIECDENAKFHLLVMDAGWAMKHKVMPWEGQRWEKAIAVPLNFAKGSLEKTVEKMEIAITAKQDDAKHGSFSIRWGTHELSAKVNFAPGAKKVDEASAKKAKEEKAKPAK